MVAGFVCRGCHRTMPSSENLEVDTNQEAMDASEGICPGCDDED